MMRTDRRRRAAAALVLGTAIAVGVGGAMSRCRHASPPEQSEIESFAGDGTTPWPKADAGESDSARTAVHPSAIHGAPVPLDQGEPSNTASLQVRTVDLLGRALPDTRVLVTSERILGDFDSEAHRAHLADAVVYADRSTGVDGSMTIEGIPSAQTVHLQAVDSTNVPLLGSPLALDLRAGEQRHLLLEQRRLYAAAFRLSDGKEVVFAGSERLSAWPVGLEPPVVRHERSRIARELGLPLDQVVVELPNDPSRADITSRLHYYHPVSGWHSGSLRVAPYIGLPNVVVLDAAKPGHRTPVTLTLLCTDASGADWNGLPVFLMETSSNGDGSDWPRISIAGRSNRPLRVPPGDYQIVFEDAALNSACPIGRSLRVEHDTVVRLPLRWRSETTSLEIRVGTRLHRGPASIAVKSPIAGASYGYRTMGAVDGRIAITVPGGSGSVLAVTVDGQRQELSIEPPVRAEYRVSFDP